MSADLKDSWFVIALPMSTVCERARYGLKRAPRAWFDILSLVLLANGLSSGMVELHEDRASAGRFLHYGTSWRAVSTNSPEPWFGESYASIALTSSGRECGVMDSLQISLYIVYIKKKIQKYKTNKIHKNHKIRKYQK